ncbi:Nicotinic acetylcholine receptor a6 subunit isoform XXII [Gryllus bimaculatus]|nr:Nicotinic acetylcholine receptor a6 subunit isoform XXII [Gryllus bimaculatus]
MGDDENRIDTCSFAHNTERVRGVAGSRHAGNGITEGETRLRRRERQRGGEQRASAIRVLVYLPGISCTPAHTCASCSPAPPPPCKWSHAKATRTEQGPHEKRLLNALLGPYNTLERPVANESEPLEVKFGLTLQQIIDVEWVDYNLRWNETEFGGVKDLRITPNKIWRPDILMYNRHLLQLHHVHGGLVGGADCGGAQLPPPHRRHSRDAAIKSVFLQWLPWILGMSRPGKKITRKTILMSNRMKELELKERSSKSLLANHVLRRRRRRAYLRGGGARWASQRARSTRPARRRRAGAAGAAGRRGGGARPAPVAPVALHPGAALCRPSRSASFAPSCAELQFITGRIARRNQEAELISDWKFAAIGGGTAFCPQCIFIHVHHHRDLAVLLSARATSSCSSGRCSGRLPETNLEANWRRAAPRYACPEEGGGSAHGVAF